MKRLPAPLAAVLALALVGALSLSGCDFTEGFDDDPNAALDAPARLLLAGGQVGLIQLVEGDFARMSTMWTGQGTGSERQYAAIQVGNVTQEDFNNTWIVGYSDALRQLQLAREGFADADNRLGVGIAKINQAIAWGVLTSLFGDIPFSQALNPDVLNPEFDPQGDVYSGIQTLLDSAISDLNSVVTNTQQNDIFARTRPQWLGIAHTLKARFYMHTGQYPQAVTAAQSGIASSAGNLIAPHGGNRNADANIFWAFIAVERAGYLLAGDAHLVHLLSPASDRYRGNAKTNESARRSYYFTGGIENAAFNTTTAGVFGAATNYPIVTFVENQLLLAEAILKSGGSEQAALDALNSVRAVHRTTFAAGQYDDYVLADFEAGGMVAQPGMSRANSLLFQVLEEKYVTLVGQIEVYNDARRTRNFLGLPSIGSFPDGIPQRFLYPQNESNANSNAPGVIPITQRTPVNQANTYSGL